MSTIQEYRAALDLYRPILENLLKTDTADLITKVEASNVHMSLTIKGIDPRRVSYILSDLEACNFDTRYIHPQVAADGRAFMYLYHKGSMLCYVCVEGDMQDLMQGLEEYRETQG